MRDLIFELHSLLAALMIGWCPEEYATTTKTTRNFCVVKISNNDSTKLSFLHARNLFAVLLLLACREIYPEWIDTATSISVPRM